VKSCYFETALLYPLFNYFVMGGLSLVLMNTNPFFTTVNGLLDSIIPVRLCLMLLNMKFTNVFIYKLSSLTASSFKDADGNMQSKVI